MGSGELAISNWGVGELEMGSGELAISNWGIGELEVIGDGQ